MTIIIASQEAQPQNAAERNEILREHKQAFAAQPEPENFIFTDKGVEFCYVPYQLNAYVFGEVCLTLPWYELGGIVKKIQLAAVRPSEKDKK